MQTKIALSVSRAKQFHLFEWISACCMTAIGVNLVIWPWSVTFSRFSSITLFLSARSLSALCLIIGVGRIIALATMGTWLPWCATTRAILGIAAHIIWLQLALSLALNVNPSMGIYVYIGLAFGELATIYRARREANGN